ncbi:MAG TPA: phosphotransferase family protein [Nocardioidaceae bacterium]
MAESVVAGRPGRSPDDLSRAVPVRAEDTFDVAAVAQWLTEHGVPGAESGAVPDVRQFPGGASNLTYELRYRRHRLILRRPPHGSRVRSAHDMRREFTVQSALVGAFPYVPRMLALCTDLDVIGSDFYVMEKVDGLILRTDPPPGFGLDKAATRRLCLTFVDRLVELHSVDVQAVGLGGLSRGDGYVARQVEGWTERFRRARTPDVPDYERTIGWLAASRPPDVAARLIHNDFRFDNVVLASDDHERIVAILDWEMATVGDPLMDVGGALAYWAQADDDPTMLRLRRQPTHLPGMLTRSEVWDRYADLTGFDTSGRRFYEVFGLFRLAVIAQQIYYRFREGQTHNPAYGRFHELVTYLDHRIEQDLLADRSEGRG